jgi:2-methylfumaryl-CoA isomerase
MTKELAAFLADQQLDGGFAREFATADGERVMVAALTRQQFADLARTTRLVQTFAFLERVLHADFSATDDLYAYRGTIAALLVPWFARRTVAELTAALTGTSVPWIRLPSISGNREQVRIKAWKMPLR